MSEQTEKNERGGGAAGAREVATRVMVVDDHPMWRDAVARDLTEAGFDVVATAATAPRRCAARRPPPPT